MNKIGIIGLGVMGSAFATNFSNKEIKTSIYNRTYEKAFHLQHNNKNLEAFESLELFIQSLEQPRKIILMVNAGEPVDTIINQLLPLLNQKDSIIDGGNSFFKDTTRRVIACENKGINFIGLGISGGEEGALNGPALMFGGCKEDYDALYPLLSKVAASKDGVPAIGYFGKQGAGHFVKMVHNGIEYAIMQLICDLYTIYNRSTLSTNITFLEVLEQVNQGIRASYLLDLTIDIMKKKDQEGHLLIDQIKNRVLQKGTGKWMCEEALVLEVNNTLIQCALTVRYDSLITSPIEIESTDIYTPTDSITLERLIHSYECALDLLFQQALHFLSVGEKTYGFEIDYASLSTTFQAGCIIQGAIFKEIFKEFINRSYQDWCSIPTVQNRINNHKQDLVRLTLDCLENQIYAPLLMSATMYLQSLTLQSDTRVIAAQRDAFGAHGVDLINGQIGVHLQWNE